MEDPPADTASESGSDLDSDSEMLSSPADSSSLTRTPPSSEPTSPVHASPLPRVPALRFSLGNLPEHSAVDSPRADSRREKAAPSRLPLIPQLPLPPTGATAAGSAQGGTVAVELLSPAFPLTHLAGPNSADLHARCASNLSIAPERLRVYALAEVPNLQSLPAGCNRVAVEVIGSHFSLQALEHMMAENQELALASAAAPAGEAKEARSQLAAAQQEIASLRRQLESSEELRQRGQTLLFELKQEFEALHRELTRETTDDGAIDLPHSRCMPLAAHEL